MQTLNIDTQKVK